MKAVVLLEVMWDWRNVTGRAGYKEQAPRSFRINPDNHSGRRLHGWLKDYPDFLVTNACPQLVAKATMRGIPDKAWTAENLRTLGPFDLLLVCGAVAQATYSRDDIGKARVLELPHPAARFWNRAGIDLVQMAISGSGDSFRIQYTKEIKTFAAITL